MDKQQRLIEFVESLDDISGSIHYEHRLNSSVVNLLRHCVDSNDDYGFRPLNRLDIDNGFCAIESYNESIKRNLQELENVIGSLYKFINGNESTYGDDRQMPLWDDDGEVPMAFQDTAGIKTTGETAQSYTGFTTGSATGITIKATERYDDK
jgi:hypothetical protein